MTRGPSIFSPIEVHCASDAVPVVAKYSSARGAWADSTLAHLASRCHHPIPHAAARKMKKLYTASTPSS